MLKGSKSLDPKRFKLKDSSRREDFSEENIESQHIGTLFDDFWERDHKISFTTRLKFRWRYINEAWRDMRCRKRNHRVWDETLNEIRPWNGYNGLLTVMQTHLRDYMESEEKGGHSAEEERNRCIASVKQTLDLLERMKEPDEYYHRLREAVEARYPDYKSLITHYKKGGTSTSGNFVAQGNGWTGMEAGNDPRAGYFEFIDGKFELASSPDQDETDRLLSELNQYHKDIENAHHQAEVDSDADFALLAELLRENMYSWWD